MLNEILEDAETGAVPQDSAIKKIAKLAGQQLHIERLIAQCEQELLDLKDTLREIAEQALPDAMAEAGVTAFTTEDGSKITVKPFYGASITEANREGCYAWLEKEGHGAIIKKDLSVMLERGDIEYYQRVTNTLMELGASYKVKEAIHAGTLQAFVKEQVEGGKDFPMDLFKVFTGRKAKIVQGGK